RIRKAGVGNSATRSYIEVTKTRDRKSTQLPLVVPTVPEANRQGRQVFHFDRVAKSQGLFARRAGRQLRAAPDAARKRLRSRKTQQKAQQLLRRSSRKSFRDKP